MICKAICLGMLCLMKMIFLVPQVIMCKFVMMIACTAKKDTSMKFWAEQFFSCHTYDTSMTIIVTKPGIIIDVVAPTSMTKNHDRKWAFRSGWAGDAAA